MTATQDIPADLTNFERTPPNDIEAEQCTLGGMMLSQTAISDVVAVLVAEDFYRPAHQMIYSAVTALYGRGDPTDAIAVGAELTKRGEIMRVQGAPYLHTLISSVPTAANAGYYAKIVKEHADRRRVIEVCTKAVQRAYVEDSDPEAILSDAHELLLRPESLTGEIPFLDHDLDDVIDWLGADPEAEQDVITLPFKDVNAAIGGMHPGELIVFGGRPARGKSIVALEVARHVALQLDKPVHLYSAEMNRKEIILRLLSAECKIDLQRLRDRQLGEPEWRSISKARGRLIGDRRLLIDDSSHATVDGIRGKLRRMIKHPEVGKMGVLIVDYLQLMKGSGNGRYESRQVEVAELSRHLKLLAREFSIPVVALAQLNRGPEQRADHKPTMSDLRESGGIENDADVVVLLHREDVYDPESPRAGETDMIVDKNRNGPRVTCTLAFQGHFSRISDMGGAR